MACSAAAVDEPALPAVLVDVEERLRASLHQVEVAVAVEVHEGVAGVGGDLAAAPAQREEVAVADGPSR